MAPSTSKPKSQSRTTATTTHYDTSEATSTHLVASRASATPPWNTPPAPAGAVDSMRDAFYKVGEVT